MLPSPTLLPHSERRGRTEPRLFTPPLRELTPETSDGFAVIDFARDVLQWPLLPWQEWLVIHAMELLEDGSYRFRNVLVLVARQNGKTSLLAVLALFWLYVDEVPLVLGTSTNLDYARESWAKAVDMAEANDWLPVPKDGIRRANGEQTLTTPNRSRYKIAAANRRGGRSLTVHRLIADELREHQNWEAWGASSNAMNAVPNGQAWALSNAGDDRSIVLNHFRATGLAETDEALGLFEWSAPDGCEIDDPEMWAYANPSMGYTMKESVIKAALVQPAAQFRTEVLCQRVASMDEAVEMEGWNAMADPDGSMDELRTKIHLCLDVGMSGHHATLVAAALREDGKVRVETVADWTDMDLLRQELPDLVAKIKPKSLAYFPNGPAATLLAEIRPIRRSRPIPANEVPAACQGLAEFVQARRVIHNADPLVAAHLQQSQRYYTGDGWRFARRGGHGDVDAAYAVAGAVHMARTQKILKAQVIVSAVP
jgi:hypothetical protein